MNYCVRFSRKFEYKEDIAEYKIVYKPKDDQLINFLNIYSDNKGNIQYFEPEEILFRPKDMWDEAGKDYKRVKKLVI